VNENIQHEEISDQFGDMSGSSKNFSRQKPNDRLALRLANVLSQACATEMLADTLANIDDITSPISLEIFVADMLPAKHSDHEQGVRLGGEIAKLWLVKEEEDEDAAFMLPRAKSAKIKTVAAQESGGGELTVRYGANSTIVSQQEYAASLILSENSTNYRPADKMVRLELRQSAKLCQEGRAPFGGDMCTICACDFEVNDSVIKWKGCAHWFHEECVLPWLRTRNTCPNCRQEVAADESAIGKIRDAHKARGTRWLQRVLM
jgi:hypothetical protein